MILVTSPVDGLSISVEVYEVNYTQGAKMYGYLKFHAYPNWDSSQYEKYYEQGRSFNSYRIKINDEVYFESGDYGYSVSMGWGGSMINQPSTGGVDNSEIEYNYDGTAAATITVEAKFDNSETYNSTVTDTYALTPFDLTSNVNFPSTAIGDEAEITIYKKNSNYRVTLAYSYGSDLSGTIVEKTSASSVKWTVPEDFYNASGMSFSKNGSATLTLTTYDPDDNVVDTRNTYFNFYVDEEKCKPDVTLSVVQTQYSDLLSDVSTKMIKFYNTVNWTASVTWKNGASAKSFSMVNGKNVRNDVTSGTIYNAESNIFKFTATDSRGISTTKTVSLNLIDYSKLTCNLAVSPLSTAGEGKLTITGNAWNGSFGKTSNTLSLAYRITDASVSTLGGSWTKVPSSAITRTGDNYKAEIDITGLDYLKTYKFEARAVDSLNKYVFTDPITLTSKPVFDWSKEDFNFNVPVNINGKLTVNGEELTPSTPATTFTTGEWSPEVNGVSSLDSAYGGYVKLGDMCILNWYATGTATSGSRIFISNLPFYPDSTIPQQSGGGTLVGAYVDGYNAGAFCGWSLEDPDSTGEYSIYARSGPVKPSATSTLVSTGSSAGSDYMKTSGSTTVTLSGTILYKVAEGE